MSIELYLAVNLAADLALIGTVSRALGMFNGIRVASAAALCTAYAVLAATHPRTWASPAVQAALVAVAALILVRGRSPRLWGLSALSIACGALLCGGAATMAKLSGPAAMPACVAVGLSPLTLLYAFRPPPRQGWEVWVRLEADSKVVRFRALIDTGNRLREPRSGLPVLIAEASLLDGLLPGDGYRVLAFGALGGEGRMACFKPDAVWIEGGRRRRRAPEVWVAASPEPLPGLYRALAPPEFAL